MLSTSSAQEYWLQALEHTRSRSPATFEQWFSSIQFDGIEFDGLEEGILHLAARDDFVLDWVKEHFLPTLLGRLRELLSSQIEVQWRIASSLDTPICAPKIPRESSSAGRTSRAPLDSFSGAGRPAQAGSPVRNVAQPSRAPAPRLVPPNRSVASLSADDTQSSSRRPSSVPSSRAHFSIGQLNGKYTFDNFIVGPSNELAYAAAFASAGEGPPRYNPLFIAGGTGLGKTHLMHAIAHKILQERPDACIVYASAERFTNEFIEALQNRKMEEFRARYRKNCDVLLLDDIQFLAGREQTQEEFFHTFNALHDAGVPIIVSSDKYPQQLQRMPERLVSRFTSGLVADVQAPRLETRVAILKKKAQIEGIDLPDSVAVALAENVKSNVRELEGALIRLAAKASLCGLSIEETLLRGDISLVAAPAKKVVCVSDIQKAVCNHFRVTNAELLSKDRHKSIAFARQVAMYLCRQRLRSSFPELGRAFGNRDHSTVMSAVRKVQTLRGKDPQVEAHLDAIECRLASNNE